MPLELRARMLLLNLGNFLYLLYSEAFSHVKISSTRLIAHLKAREKLSFTMLVADFRGAQKNHKSQKNCSMSTVFLRNIQG